MSSYLLGSDTYSIDNKGRVAIPAKIRRLVGPESDNRFIVTRGIDKCVVCYPLKEWEIHSLNMRRLSPFNRKERYVVHVMNMWMEEIEMDGQSRIMLSKQLLEFAGIADKVKIVGMIDHLQIWDPVIHDAYITAMESEQTYEESVQQVFEMKYHE